ncbi:MAG: hypothetical protein J6P82_04205 [Bacteroidales bacterium]|nr:hypothetical protein [Bacteroidales bacterium]MBO7378672.1 hypothetical protein [Bacteroidales bacterium]
MKRYYSFLLALLATLAFVSCGSLPVSQQSGADDVAYLLFVSPDQYKGENVSVQLDGTTFQAEVVSEKKAHRKGTAYRVAPGTRSLTVKDNQGKILYQKQIFLSTQETKKILLP